MKKIIYIILIIVLIVMIPFYYNQYKIYELKKAAFNYSTDLKTSFWGNKAKVYLYSLINKEYITDFNLLFHNKVDIYHSYVNVIKNRNGYKYELYIDDVNESFTSRNIRLISALNEDNKDYNGYFSGVEVNNYVWFSGQVWRIIDTKDGIKMITESPVTSIKYGESSDWKTSYVREWLNDLDDKKYDDLNKTSLDGIFYDSLSNKELIKKTNFCIGKASNVKYDFVKTVRENNGMNILEEIEDNSECNEITEDYVGLITASEYFRTFKDGKSFLSNSNYSYTVTPYDDNILWYIYGFSPGYLMNEKFNLDDSYSIRPVIVLDENVEIYAGNGSKNNFYRIAENKSNNLSKRNIGEFVSYSNYLFRIINIDSNESVKLKLYSLDNRIPYYLYKTDNKEEACYGIEKKVVNGCTTKFDSKQGKSPLFRNNKYVAIKNNIAYYLNGDDSLSFYNRLNNNSYLIDYKFYDGEYEGDYKTAFNSFVNNKVGLTRVGEMFSGNDNSYYYWTLNSNDGKIIYINFDGKLSTEYSCLNFWSRPIIVLKKDINIIDGDGTENNPLIIK